MSDTPQDRSVDFLVVEYGKAIETYALGVNLGMTYVRVFLVAQGILFALFAAALRVPLSSYWGEVIVLVVAAVGIFSSLTLRQFTRYYRQHLENCARRSAEIEAEFGGKLFSSLTHITDVAQKVPTDSIRNLFLLFAIAWLVIGTAVFIIGI